MDGAMTSGVTRTRRMAWASYGAAISLAIGTVVGLGVDLPELGAVGAALGVVTGVVVGRQRERRRR
jgi:hypothetical protein